MKLVTTTTLLCVLIAVPRAQLLPSQAKGAARAQIGMLSVGGGGCGAGIVVGYDASRVYLATAAHVVVLSGRPLPPPITVLLEGLPGETRPGTMGPNFSPPDQGDLAVVTIARDPGVNAFLNGLDFALLSPVSTPNDSPVTSIGCSGGQRWTSGTNEMLRAPTGGNLAFDTTVTRGQSGGGLFNDAWELIGMPYVEGVGKVLAHPAETMLQKLRDWKVPVRLSERPLAQRVRGADELAREARAQTLSTQAQTLIQRGGDGSLAVAYAAAASRLATPTQPDVASDALNAMQRAVFLQRLWLLGPDPFEELAASFASVRADTAVTRDENGAIVAWSADGEKPRLRLSDSSSGSGFHLSPDGQIVAIARGSIVQLRAIVDGRSVAQLNVPRPTLSMAYSSDGKTLAVEGDDRVIRVWKTGGTQPTVQITNTSDPRRFAVCNDADTVGIADAAGTVRVVSAGTGRELARVGATPGAAFADLAFLPECRQLVIAAVDGSARAVAVRGGGAIVSVASNEKDPEGVALSRDGRFLAIASHIEDEYDPFRVHVVSIVDDRRLSLTFPGGFDGGFDSVEFTADSRGLILTTHSQSGGGAITLVHGYRFDLNGREEFTISTDSTVATVRFLADGSLLALASTAGELRALDANGARTISSNPLTTMALGSKGAELATASADGTVRVIGVTTGTELTAPMRVRGKVTGLVFSPDGRLFVATDDRQVLTLDTARSRWSDRTITDCCRPGALSADAQWLLFVHEGIARVVTTATGQVIRAFQWMSYEPDFNEPSVIAISSDGRTALVGQEDGDTLVLDISTIGAPKATDTDSDAPVAPVVATAPGNATAVAISRGGKLAVIASDGGVVRIVQMPSGREVMRLNAGSEVTTADVTDSGIVAIGDVRGHVRVWNTSGDVMLKRLCASQGSNISRTVWGKTPLNALPWTVTCENWPVPK